MGGSGDPKVPGDPWDHGIVPILPLDKINSACYNIPEAHRKAPITIIPSELGPAALPPQRIRGRRATDVAPASHSASAPVPARRSDRMDHRDGCSAASASARRMMRTRLLDAGAVVSRRGSRSSRALAAVGSHSILNLLRGTHPSAGYPMEEHHYADRPEHRGHPPH